jgi:ATP-dependent Lhr-like helicase
MDDTAPIPSAAPTKAAFELLHPGVQRQLWKMGWTQLRPLQVEAIRLVMGAESPLVLAAATASGKTEAAFLPILSKIADNPSGSVRTIYVGPLKALINDQFARIEELCGYLDVPVFRWHGDVAAAHKDKLIKEPGGVLLITPESLESLFVNRSQFLPKLFAGLRFVVIDELHSFLANERGLHLRSLLARVGRFAPSGYRPVALSATIGDFSAAQRYLDPDDPDRVKIVQDKSGQKELKYRIHGYRSVPRIDAEADDSQPPDATCRAAADIVKHCAGTANLVFTNARGDVEEYAYLCRRIAENMGIPATFLVHHGSLSAEIRDDAEQTMKEGKAATTFCSSTLEMGIDIGSVHMVGQIDSPWSVASLKQRLGRSGRKEGEPQIMRVYIQCRDGGPDADLFDRLNLELLQAIAVTELMLEGWVEPPSPPLFDLSTLTQQVISAIAETGGLRADVLFERLCVRGPFREIDSRLFRELLRQLAREDVIEQMDGADLILGLKGEQLRKDKGFYAVFPTPGEYTVLNRGVVLGKLESAHQPGDHLLFAGGRWRVVDVDDERLQLHVEPAKGWKRPRFGGGVGEVHTRVRRKMKDALLNPPPMVYLDAEARALFDDAARSAMTGGILNWNIVALGPRDTALMTWTGSRAQETLVALLASFGIDTRDEGIALVFDMNEDGVRKAIRTCLDFKAVPEVAAEKAPTRQRRKYDWLLGEKLLDLSIARGRLDLVGALETLVELYS